MAAALVVASGLGVVASAERPSARGGRDIQVCLAPLQLFLAGLVHDCFCTGLALC